MEETNLIVIKVSSLESLHDSIGEAIERLYEMQDFVADRIEHENWLADYLRGPFWFL